LIPCLGPARGISKKISKKLVINRPSGQYVIDKQSID
jgi:hypothetical protein